MKAITPLDIADFERRNSGGGDIDCLPFKALVGFFVRWAFDRGDTEFTSTELRDLFLAVGFQAPRTGKPIHPSVREVEAALSALSAAGELLFQLGSSSQYELPWQAINQEWRVSVNAPERAKAERLLERVLNRVGREPGGFIRPQADTTTGAWAASHALRLEARAWPCAVAEALVRASSIHPRWSIETGKFGVSGATLLSPSPPLHAAHWTLVPINRGTA